MSYMPISVTIWVFLQTLNTKGRRYFSLSFNKLNKIEHAHKDSTLRMRNFSINQIFVTLTRLILQCHRFLFTNIYVEQSFPWLVHKVQIMDLNEQSITLSRPHGPKRAVDHTQSGQMKRISVICVDFVHESFRVIPCWHSLLSSWFQNHELYSGSHFCTWLDLFEWNLN